MKKDNDELKNRPLELILWFVEVWKWHKKDDYVFSPKDFKHAKEYLHLGEPSKEMIQSRARIYMKTEFYEKCGWNFSAFINNISSFLPPKWCCEWCKEWHSGNISQKRHTEECAKNPKFNEVSGTTVDAIGGLVEKFKAFCPKCEGTKEAPRVIYNDVKCENDFHLINQE